MQANTDFSVGEDENEPFEDTGDGPGCSKKQLIYKGMSVEASCRKFLGALAIKIALMYDFPSIYRNPTIGDVLAAKKGQQGRSNTTNKNIKWWDFRDVYIDAITTPLPSLFSLQQWDLLESLESETKGELSDALLPRTSKII